MTTFIDHDRLFKELITTFFKDFMELFFPETIDSIDFDHLKFSESEIFTDVIEGERHRVDILVETRLRDEPGMIMIHVEPQSYYQKDFNRRMFIYFSRLLQKHHRPILPIAVFSYERKSLNEPDNYDVTFPFLDVLKFRFYKVELRNLDYRTYLSRPNPVAAALMTKMGFDKSEGVKVKFECLRMLVSLKLDPAKQHLIFGFMNTYLRLNREEVIMFEEKVEQELGITEKNGKLIFPMNEWEEIGYEKGIEEGIEKGVKKGIKEGELKLVLNLIHKRFAKIPHDVEERIGDLATSALEEFVTEFLDFQNMTDIEVWLDQHS